MKKVFEKIKDILYASIDYLIMLSIIVAVILIIGWRLDILFQKDGLTNIPSENIEVENQEDKIELSKEDFKKDKNERNNGNLQKNSEKDLETMKNSEEKNSENISKDNLNIDIRKPENKGIIAEDKDILENMIEINIPEGSFPSEIASILESNELIEDTTEFIKKSVDLNLDTKFKSGTFLIPENSSIETIAKIISKQESGN